MSISRWFERLSTGGKLLLILSIAVLPLGLVLIWAATSGLNQASTAVVARANDQSRVATRAIEGFIARNALALRIASSGALRQDLPAPCDFVAQSLAMSPTTTKTFALRDRRGVLICASPSSFPVERPDLLVAPGNIRLWISRGGSALFFRVGLSSGHATGLLTRDELRNAALASPASVDSLVLSDGTQDMQLIDERSIGRMGMERIAREHGIGNGQLAVRTVSSIPQIASLDRLIIVLPVLMWVIAALLSWLLVSRFLLRPLKRMQRSVSSYQPGQGALAIPAEPGSAIEIQEFGQAFSRVVDRIEQHEHDLSEALEGQRKLVREVHHRVKNNLQVVASLLNIHGRTAASDEARDAYSSIGRRVDALAVVHRNHYAELEENRGIALRPLLSELAASLRASAPESARAPDIDLDLESLNTTQDVAVAIAFLTTEIVEFAMLTQPDHPVELRLYRTGELSARFELVSPVLDPGRVDEPDRRQFERIIAGLAKQLRSSLDREQGRYSVDLAVFPPR